MAVFERLRDLLSPKTDFKGEIPPLPGYCPNVHEMDAKQLRFYRYLESKLKRGEHVNVQGEIGYVYAFVYGYIQRWNERGFESLYEFLTHLAELYVEEKKLSRSCRHWATDCLLGLGKYEEYLERTEPLSLTRVQSHLGELRLNLQRHIGLPANPIDVLTGMETRRSKVIDENLGAYRDCVTRVFEQYERENGSWYEILLRVYWEDREPFTYAHKLFAGVPMSPPKLPLEMKSYFSVEASTLVQELARDAENLLRTELGVPRIGEGWVSETLLYKRLADEFPETLVVQHGRPHWLGRQHLDIWFPDWRIGVEYHGKQHFEPVEFFGGEDAFEQQRERDKRKARLCQQHSVALFVVTEDDEVERLIDSIRERYRRLRKHTRAPRLS